MRRSSLAAARCRAAGIGICRFAGSARYRSSGRIRRRDAAAASCASAVLSRNTPSGKTLVISSRTQRCASTGSIFQIVGQGDRTSTSEKPRPFTWFSSALLDDLRGAHDLLVVAQRDAFDKDRRFERWPAVRRRAADSLRSRRCGRAGDVVLFLPSGVVGAIWPPVMP